MDATDQYIIEHHRSMSQNELAQKLGINKSTVSRRMSKLRESGEMEAAPNGTGVETQLARNRLRGCTMNRADRLAALGELKDMLHADLLTSGGSSLARVASEYRRTLEEIEGLSVEMNLTANGARELNPVDLILLKHDCREKFRDTCDGDTATEIVNFTLCRLDELKIISCKPSDRILSDAGAMEYGIAEGGEHAER